MEVSEGEARELGDQLNRTIGHRTAEALEAARKVSSTDEEYFRAATGLLEALCKELAKDAERFRYLQNIPVVQAQQYFWNHQSRKQRAEAIDFDMKQNVPVIEGKA